MARIRSIGIPWLIVMLAVAWGFINRRQLLVYGASLLPPPELLAPVDEGPNARWVDDYYTVERIDERTFAIGEPRLIDQNFNFLILGSERAVLFDAGPGVRNIRPIVESITDLPITFIPSHFHFDHVGSDVVFDSVAMAELPGVRERTVDGVLTFERMEHLGFVTGFPIRSLTITEWIEIGGSISLGDRTLQVLHTPGHTPDSISLFEEATGYLFAGDFIHPGSLFGFLPNSSMREYAAGAETLVNALPPNARIFGAHRLGPPGMPELAFEDVTDLQDTLEAIRNYEISGEGAYPRSFRINERVELQAEPRWLQRW